MDNSKLIKALADAGFRESALLLKNWDEMDANAERLSKAIYEGHVTEVGSSGESSGGAGYVSYDNVNKAGEVKPFNTRIVDEKNNIQRKSGRVGDQRVDAAGKNRAIQRWAKGGKVGGAKAEAAAQAKADKKKSAKNPVKTMSQFSPEEIKAMEDRANANLKKNNNGQWQLDGTETTLLFKTNETKQAGKNEVIERRKVDPDSPEGQEIFKNFADSIRAGVPQQPTDEQLFGHLVKSEEEIQQAEEIYKSRLNFYNDWAAGRIKTSGEKPEDNESWGSGTSFNSSLSPEELKKRNSYTGD